MADSIYNSFDLLPSESRPMDKGTNNEKLFSFIVDYGLKIYSDTKKIDSWRSIDEAQGLALDEIGKNYGEYRGEADDTFFRFMIKSKILASRSKGTVNDVINIISKSLNVEKDKVSVEMDRSLQGGKFVGAPFTVSVRHLPLSFTANDFQKRYLISRIEEAVAEGIKVGEITFLDFSTGILSVGGSQSIRRRYISESSVMYNTLVDNYWILSERTNGKFIEVDGSIQNSGTGLAAYNQKYIGIAQNQKVKIAITETDKNAPSSAAGRMAFYDKDKKFIGVSANIPIVSGSYIYSCPDSTYYFRMSLFNYNNIGIIVTII